MMSDYKVEMINDGMQEFYVDFHGPKDSKSSLPTSIFFIFFSFDFQSDICVSFHILYFNCVDQVKNMLLGFLVTLDLDGHTIVSDHVSELLNFIMVLN
jgi:hypothetical protein